MTLGITYGITTTYNRFVIGPHVHFHIKRYLTDDIHFDSHRLPWVSTMFKLHGVNWVKTQKYCDILEWNLDITNLYITKSLV